MSWRYLSPFSFTGLPSLGVYSIIGSKHFRGYPREYLITREDYIHCVRVPAWRDGALLITFSVSKKSFVVATASRSQAVV